MPPAPRESPTKTKPNPQHTKGNINKKGMVFNYTSFTKRPKNNPAKGVPFGGPKTTINKWFCQPH
jgi:hypothetical protein